MSPDTPSPLRDALNTDNTIPISDKGAATIHKCDRKANVMKANVSPKRPQTKPATPTPEAAAGRWRTMGRTSAGASMVPQLGRGALPGGGSSQVASDRGCDGRDVARPRPDRR